MAVRDILDRIFDPYGSKAFAREQIANYQAHARSAMANPTKEALKAAEDKTREGIAAMGEKVNKMHMATFESELAKAERKMLEGGIVRRSARRLGKVAKWGAIGAAGLAAVGIISSSMRKGREAHEPVMPQSDPELAALEASVANNQLAGPADGRAPNEWQSRIRGAAQQGLAQPTPSVAEGAQNMGATRT